MKLTRKPNSATESDSASRSSSKNKKIRPEDYSGYDSVSRAHHSDLKHREWFIFDNALVLPEYIVEYELVTKAHLQAESHGLQCVFGGEKGRRRERDKRETRERDAGSPHVTDHNT